MLNLANQELRRKERVLRDTKKRLEGLEGRNLENKNKNDLLALHKQLNESLKLVTAALEKSKH